jgi:hypothetical protein
MKHLIKENTSLRRLYYCLQMARAKGQSDESRIIAELPKDARAPSSSSDSIRSNLTAPNSREIQSGAAF